jgi:NADPH:quinone reductase-like Zn-dependent oxidoreductase
MTNGEMPAAVIRRHAVPPEPGQWPIPHRGKGQALVRVTAAPISPLDLLCASGMSYFGPPHLPSIPGVQGIGIVVEADKLVPGQRIWFSCDAGVNDLRSQSGGLHLDSTATQRIWQDALLWLPCPTHQGTLTRCPS